MKAGAPTSREHGSVVGAIDNFPGRIGAFYWRDGIETRLPHLGGIANGASAVNDNEIIVGHSSQDPNPDHENLYFPVVWKDGVDEAFPGVWRRARYQ